MDIPEDKRRWLHFYLSIYDIYVKRVKRNLHLLQRLFDTIKEKKNVNNLKVNCCIIIKRHIVGIHARDRTAEACRQQQLLPTMRCKVVGHDIILYHQYIYKIYFNIVTFWYKRNRIDRNKYRYRIAVVV